MTIPTSSNFPTSYDTEANLFLVHDGLRVRLLEDYSPGNTTILIEGDADVIAQFPTSGLITLTEQVSDIDERAISFYYSSRTDTSFDGLEILSGFADVVKPKRVTNVTQNVMASHHNHLKDALIAIEEFVGVKGTIDTAPFGNTMMGRINFLRKLVLSPRAWFTANKTVGIVPLTITFTDKSFRFGDGSVLFVWDFGDHTSSNISYISAISMVPFDQINVMVEDMDGGDIEKTYETPGIYDVSLQVTNDYGTDTLLLKDFITARIEAPQEATISLIPTSLQNASIGDDPPLFDRLDGVPGNGYTIPPTIRSVVNSFVYITIPTGENPSNPGYSYGGERLISSIPIDPIETYTWSLGDDLVHSSNKNANASYSIGGIYDIKLRADTTLGAFRITTYQNVIDIIEKRNVWLFNKSSGLIKANEFGLISETFKVATQTHAITQDDSFLTGTGEETRAKAEFIRNISFVSASSTNSGNKGDAILFWSEGGSPLSAQTTGNISYNGFDDTYGTTSIAPSALDRPWNWITFHTGAKSYFLFGPDPSAVPYTNLSNQDMFVLDLITLAVSTTTLSPSYYLGNATELQQHITSSYDLSGEPLSGRYAAYRTTWKGSSGYILRNESTGWAFRLKSFYKTSGTISDPILSFMKLPDMPGNTKTEGQLVTMDNGIFFFNNSGNIAAYNDTSGAWETGTSSTTSFRSLQDSSVSGFDDESNTLLAVSDGGRITYLSYDYSENAVIKFNGVDLTFSLASSRPAGTQWAIGVY